jgi:hypothetical protein
MRSKRAMLVVGLAIILTGCGSDDTTSDPVAAEPSAPADEATSPAAETPEAASPLDGTWKTSAISTADAEDTLRRYGLAKRIDEFRSNSPFAGDTVLILQVADGGWDLYGKSKSEGRYEIDYNAESRVEGSNVVVSHATGSNKFRWSVEGDALTLKWLSGSNPPYEGIPDEVFQRALYMTSDFERL